MESFLLQLSHLLGDAQKQAALEFQDTMKTTVVEFV